jgi:hypothetical protein
MPKLISFDIGIRNLAYCIFDLSGESVSIIDWNVIDISILKPESIQIPNKCSCKKNAKYSMSSLFFCEKHAKASSFHFPSNEFEKSVLKKCSVDSLRELEKKWNIPLSLSDKKELKIEKLERIEKWIETHVLRKIEAPKKKKESLDFIQIGRNLAVHLSKLDLDDIMYVIIENQISPIANKMRTIQGMVAQMFILRDVPTIEFVSSSNKLREYLGEKKKVVDKPLLESDQIQNPDYKQHKKDGIRYTREWLESEKSGFSPWKTFFDTYPRKQDDLADSFLQGIWYLRKKMGISLEK